MDFGVDIPLDTLQNQINAIVGSSAFMYLVGGVLAVLFFVGLVNAIRKSLARLGVNVQLENRVTIGGVSRWTSDNDWNEFANWAGLQEVGRQVGDRDYVAVDGEGQELAYVRRELYDKWID